MTSTDAGPPYFDSVLIAVMFGILIVIIMVKLGIELPFERSWKKITPDDPGKALLRGKISHVAALPLLGLGLCFAIAMISSLLGVDRWDTCSHVAIGAVLGAAGGAPSIGVGDKRQTLIATALHIPVGVLLGLAWM